MKNHFQPTTGQVSQIRRPDDTVPLVGSVALNFNCGGVDDHGVRAGLSGWKRDVTAADVDRDRFVVWMPTMCCEAHLRCYNRRDISTAWGVKAEYTRFYAEGTGYQLDPRRCGQGLRARSRARPHPSIRPEDSPPAISTATRRRSSSSAPTPRAFAASS